MLELNKIYNADSLELMPEMRRDSVDLIIADPPYNIGKDTWDKIKNYDDFMHQFFTQSGRVLKDNGSFYWFHNDMAVVARFMEWIKNNTDMVFKQMIVWNKKFDGYWNQLNAIVGSDDLRNYSKQCEYILYYTFQDETGLTTVMLDTNNFSTLRQYFNDFQDDSGMTKKSIMDIVGQSADHCFRWNSTQWDLPTKETYTELCKLPQTPEFVRREYESLRREYESLRREYESLRYTFNNQKTHHSVWNYEIAKRNGHATPKPPELIKNIILHSSNEGDTILDPFTGYAVVPAEAIKLKRKYIAIEKDSDNCAIAQKRVDYELSQLRLEL